MDVRLWSRTDDSRRIRRPLGTFMSLVFFHFLIDFSLILRFSEDFLSFIFFFLSPPFYPSKIIYFSVIVYSLFLWCLDLASFKKYFVIECLLKKEEVFDRYSSEKRFLFDIEDPSDSNV